MRYSDEHVAMIADEMRQDRRYHERRQNVADPRPRFDWLLVVCGLVGAAIIAVMMMLPAERVPRSGPWSARTEQIVQRASAHCDDVWIEHKIKPALADEVLARGCH